MCCKGAYFAVFVTSGVVRGVVILDLCGRGCVWSARCWAALPVAAQPPGLHKAPRARILGHKCSVKSCERFDAFFSKFG